MFKLEVKYLYFTTNDKLKIFYLDILMKICNQLSNLYYKMKMPTNVSANLEKKKIMKLVLILLISSF